jgi:hypothetical protein
MANTDFVIDDLVTLVKKYGVSQVSARLGVTRAAIYLWIHRKRQPGIDTSISIIDLRDDPHVMVEIEDTTPPPPHRGRPRTLIAEKESIII